MDTITIRKPDDFHVHLRDGAMLEAVLPHTARVFARALVMPNLAPNPVTTTEALLAYRERVLKAAQAYPTFTPLMSYYLTDASDGGEITEGYKNGIAAAVKMYPAGATTNSAQGVTNVEKVYSVFEKMQNVGIPLLLHGETLVTKNGTPVDPYDREKIFLEETLVPLLSHFPALKVVLEHATTKDAVQFIQNDHSGRLASTVTVHHLVLTKDEATTAYEKCMPIIKSREDREALRAAVTSGDLRFFLGTDSAPHTVLAKESATPPAGVFTAPAALELYAQVFEEEGKLEHLEKFTSLNGARFYGIEPNTETVTLKKQPWTIENTVSVSNGDVIRPFGYHEKESKRLSIPWHITSR